MPDTLHAAGLKLLLWWSHLTPPEKQILSNLEPYIDALGDAVNAVTIQRSKQVNRQTVGRKQHAMRSYIQRQLRTGKTVAEIAKITGASASTVTRIKRELKQKVKP